MARSSCIYVLQGTLLKCPLAAFTVKYEMVDWLNRHPDYSPCDITIKVFRDGDPSRVNPGDCRILSWSRNDDDGTVTVEGRH